MLPKRLLPVLLGLVFALAPAWAQRAAAVPAPIVDPSYRILDNVEGSHVDLVFAPIRPMAITNDITHLYAVNTHNATVVDYDTTLTLQNTFAVPWGPVSIAIRELPTRQLLVVSKGNHALVALDPTTGQLQRYLQLPTEPADIVLNAAQTFAYISCQGADQVVEVNLTTWVISRRFSIPSKHPTFLSWMGNDLLVAPMFSGNNTAVDKSPVGLLAVGPDRILDLNTQSPTGLPDQDIFRITLGGTPTVTALAAGVGSVLFAHGINPVNPSTLWVLNTDAKNTIISEPTLKGDFIDNRLTRVNLTTPTLMNHLNLDTTLTLPPIGGVPQTWRPVGQPYGLSFSNTTGIALVAGLTTNAVTIFDANGAPLAQWALQGQIPRATLIVDGVNPAGNPAPIFGLVYCWGSNTIEIFSMLSLPSPTAPAILSLGYDPTPVAAKKGRDLFFNGAHSDDGDTSCASCHVEGLWDMLPWDLSDLDSDDKGPLMTQNLRGISHLVPLHWRGERRLLEDFNGAFPNLLGGSELNATEFASFKEFVFSMANPANPNQHRDREINPSFSKFHNTATGLTPNAANGQIEFHDNPSTPGCAICQCSSCHTMPTGTSNDSFPDEGAAPENHRVWFKVAPFSNGLWRKEMPSMHNVGLYGPAGPPTVVKTVTLPTLGTAVSATGLAQSAWDFVNIFPASNQVRLDVTSFILQADSGLAPTVHEAVFMQPNNTLQTNTAVKRLISHADLRDNDIAVFGTDPTGTSLYLRWAYDRYSRSFLPEDSALTPRLLADFVTAARNGDHFIFLGLPTGMADRFAIDYDKDDITNRNDAQPYTPSPPTGTPPPILLYQQVLWNTTEVARLNFDTDVNTIYKVTYKDTNSFRTSSVSSNVFGRTHSVVLSEMLAGQVYDVTIEIWDRANQYAIRNFPAAFTNNLLTVMNGGIVADFQVQNLVTGSSSFSFDLAALINDRPGKYEILSFPLAGWDYQATIFPTGATPFTVTGSVSGSSGWSTVPVTISGLTNGQKIKIALDWARDPAGSTAVFSFPDTPKEHRDIFMTFPTGVDP